MSEIKVDTLTGKTTANDITVTVGATATMSLEQGLAKCWMHLTGTGTIAVNDSLNVTSCTDGGTGRYKPQYTNSFNSVNYTPQGIDDAYGVGWTNAFTTGEVQNVRANNSFSVLDVGIFSFSAHGDLA